MKGCHVLQCLVEKQHNQLTWIPEADDQDFGLESDYFLTGVSDGRRVPEQQEPLTCVKPHRHGVEKIVVAIVVGPAS